MAANTEFYMLVKSVDAARADYIDNLHRMQALRGQLKQSRERLNKNVAELHCRVSAWSEPLVIEPTDEFREFDEIIDDDDAAGGQ